jgi:hypothetical protein
MKPLITNLILSAELADYLDQQCLAIRRTVGASISRSALLRGIVGGIKTIPLSFSSCGNEKSIAEGLARLLRNGLRK